MASASAVLTEIGKDFLECGICFERYTHPKILSCVHSFCEKCLVQYYGNDVVKTCPVCRQETRLPVPGGISGLKTNGFIITLREKVELQEKVAKLSDKARRTCELCTENEVTHHCLNCSQNICQGCMNIHRRIKVSAGHTVGTLEDIREGKVTLPEVQKEYTCNTHKGEINRFYCETCHVLICHVCTVVNHCKPEHQYIDCATASSKYKKGFKELFPTINNEIKHVEECLDLACKAQQQFERKVSQTVQEVKKEADWARDKVKAEEDRILREIRVLKEDRSTAFDEQIKTMQSLLQRKQDTLTIARDVTNKGSDSDFLSLFPIIDQDLTFLKSNKVPPQIDASFHYQRLDQTGSIKLGNLETGTKWKLRLEVSQHWMMMESFCDIAALPGDRLAVTTAITPLSRDGKLVICRTDGKHEKTIPMKLRGQNGIASFRNGLMVADYQDGCVRIYNKDFTTSQLHPFLDVKIDETSRRKGYLDFFDSYTCICVKKDGTILVGLSTENAITLIHRPAGKPIYTTRISLPKSPRFLATDCNDTIVVSGRDEVIIVIDDQGATLFTIKPTMNGQPVSFCSGVCCDGSDIYVAVYTNRYHGPGHIHRYGGDGKFISCIIQGLRPPMGITFTEDGQHLAVVDDNGVNIYQKV
ncbi:E3 ubiquitin-protein ligase TRIM56-like [Asterias rubens]|uniref:E3 ubiquitin-protein ligase TRIM56-like n=1 Tax=Asterias rubens TaxID=7604 RepID=UPI001454ED2A|nr:E3 ubiquitin-protein ligase TRIM56-like [Asterias rubens]